jgi:hypothetical protein
MVIVSLKNVLLEIRVTYRTSNSLLDYLTAGSVLARRRKMNPQVSQPNICPVIAKSGYLVAFPKREDRLLSKWAQKSVVSPQ